MSIYIQFCSDGIYWDLLWVSKTPIKSFQELRAPILYSHQKTWKVAGTDFVLVSPPKKRHGRQKVLILYYSHEVLGLLQVFTYRNTQKKIWKKNIKNNINNFKKHTLIGSCIKLGPCVNSFDRAIFGIPIKSRIVPPKSH